MTPAAAPPPKPPPKPRPASLALEALEARQAREAAVSESQEAQQALKALRARALRCLALREHSRSELERKLARPLGTRAAGGMGRAGTTGAAAAAGRAAREAPHADEAPDPGAAPADSRTPAAAWIAQVLDELAALGLLSEERAAQALVSAQAARSGARKLQQSLRARGVAPEAAAAALAAVAGTEFERAQALWQRRYGQVAADATERARQARYLAGRGFSSEVIRRVVRGLDLD